MTLSLSSPPNAFTEFPRVYWLTVLQSKLLEEYQIWDICAQFPANLSQLGEKGHSRFINNLNSCLQNRQKQTFGYSGRQETLHGRHWDVLAPQERQTGLHSGYKGSHFATQGQQIVLHNRAREVFGPPKKGGKQRYLASRKSCILIASKMATILLMSTAKNA